MAITDHNLTVIHLDIAVSKQVSCYSWWWAVEMGFQYLNVNVNVIPGLNCSLLDAIPYMCVFMAFYTMWLYDS